MNLDALSELGKIAGIAGIAVGALVLIFSSVIRKKIFPGLTRDQGYKVIRMIVIFAGLLAFIGIAAWVYLDVVRNTTEKEKRLTARYVLGEVHTEAGDPVISANVEVSQDNSFLDKTDGNGRFALQIKGIGKKYYDIVISHKSYRTSRQKVKIDFDKGEDEISLQDPIVLLTAYPPPQEDLSQIPVDPVDSDPIREQSGRTSSQPVSTTTTGYTASSVGSITLNYMGDLLDCELELYIDLGGKVVNPSANRFQVAGVHLGAQNYQVSGYIDCGYSGNCQAQGTGVVNLVNQGNYYIMWNMYTCEVGVYNQQDFNRISGL